MAYDPNNAGVQANAKLGFKVGTQSALDLLLTQSATAIQNNTQGPATHGSFYLTSDTHRLYVGNSNGTLSPVNEGIITVNTINDLPRPSAVNAGQFYYINGETGDDAAVKNVLTVSNGHQWVHINANTNTFIKEHKFITVTVPEGGGLVTDSITLTDGDDRTSRFHIKGANGVSVAASTATVTITEGAITREITVPAITITGDTYTLSSAATAGQTNKVDIKLDATNANNSSKVTLAAANDPKGNATVAISESDGTISISARDTRNATVSIDNGDQTATTPTTTGFTVNVTDNYGDTKSGAFDPKVQVGNHTAVSFNNGVATLDVYTKKEVDDTLKVLNAMTYRGTIGVGGTAATAINPTTHYPQMSNQKVDVSVGDTFLVVSAINYNGTSVPVNSLLIARGTEDPDTGYITSDLTYDIVQSTQNVDTTYTFQATSDGLYLQPKTGGTAGELSFVAGTAADDAIGITFTASDAGSAGSVVTNGKQTVTISHKDVQRNDPAKQTVTGTRASNTAAGQTTIPVVTGVTSDSKGHVKAVSITDYTISDTNAKITGNETTATGYTKSGKNVGIIKNQLTTTYGDGSDSNTSSYEAISSESLTITVDNANTISTTNNDTVAGLNIEMVWGSFGS